MRNYFVEIKDLVVAEQVGDKSNVVYKVEWFYVCEDDVASVIVTTSKTLQLDVTDLSDFVEFDSLTKEQVIGWVEETLTENDIVELKAELDKKIEEHNMRLRTRHFPWATTP